jgi:GntR family transcriptional regulator
MNADSLSAPRGLSPHGQAPLYKEVEREIMQCLARGEWKPGDRLPAEPELAERFGVAVFTLRAGIQKLVDAGILTRRQGKGTFVTLHRARPLRNQFLRIYSNDGRKASWDRHLIAVEKARATDAVAGILQLGPAAADRAIYEVPFLLKNADRNVAYVESKMVAKHFGQVTDAALRGTTDNLYGVFQERFGVNVIAIDERVRAVRAPKAAVKWLGTALGDPLLRMERIAYTYNHVPVEFRTYDVQAADYYYSAPSG